MEGALVLVSGGLDSAVALYWARDRGWEVHPLTIDFRNRPLREIRAAEEVVEAARCRLPLLRVSLPFLAEVEDLRAEGRTAPLLDDAPPSYAPARNLVFYAVAAHFAEILGVHRIVGGHNGADSETFPDATPSFFRRFNDLLAEGLLTHPASGLEVVNPLQGLTKADVVRLGAELGAPLALTWSCHRDREVPCGACSSCREREAAFAATGWEDPLLATLRGRG